MTDQNFSIYKIILNDLMREDEIKIVKPHRQLPSVVQIGNTLYDISLTPREGFGVMEYSGPDGEKAMIYARPI